MVSVLYYPFHVSLSLSPKIKFCSVTWMHFPAMYSAEVLTQPETPPTFTISKRFHTSYGSVYISRSVDRSTEQACRTVHSLMPFPQCAPQPSLPCETSFPQTEAGWTWVNICTRDFEGTSRVIQWLAPFCLIQCHSLIRHGSKGSNILQMT